MPAPPDALASHRSVVVSNGLADNRGYGLGGLVTSLAGLLIGVVVTVSVGSLGTHWDDPPDVARCLDRATTDEEREACAQEFADAVD